jgi:serine/threonine-protein kinase
MNCPSCQSPLEQNARFCGVCGYRLQPSRPGAPQQGSSPAIAAGSSAGRAPSPPAGSVARPQPGAGGAVIRPQSPARPDASPVKANAGAAGSPGAGAAAKRPAKATKPKADDIYLGQVLNNRFKVESKIGEGGFGAVYRGVQLATGRKVALKLLHPEMTKDENLVARFRREGMVLCNLRDAHTITTYDFDQTPDGTLYIAMELLEGKSLHQIFHDQAPLEWRRIFKILTEMCSSLAEAHQQGIVHRDLKPENVYLESRPGNPEFVKILDFGIAKVMRGDTIDPQSPQLTATGQTLGTLEYMSPEQLMGKPLDGRSDVYALGVVAYEMTTGRLPFPDAKGPAGLITAQLKQTPLPPSKANPKVQLPPAADAVILKCLEKDKNNRYADVSALSAGLQEVLTQEGMAASGAGSQAAVRLPEMQETRRGDLPNMVAPAVPAGLAPGPLPMMQTPLPGMGPGPMHGSPMPGPLPVMQTPQPIPQTPMPHGGPGMPGMPGGSPMVLANPPAPRPITPAPGVPQMPPQPIGPSGPPAYGPGGPPPGFPPQSPYPTPYPMTAPPRSKRWIWWIVGLLVFGAGIGALAAVLTG